MKYLISIAVGLVIVLIFAVSCGMVSQEAYDKATNDLVSLNATYEQANNDLKLKATALDFLVARYDAASNNLTGANTKLEKLRLEVGIYNAVFIPALTGDLDTATESEKEQIISGIETNIDLLNDPVLSQKYEDMKYSAGNNATEAFFLYLLQDIQKTLE